MVINQVDFIIEWNNKCNGDKKKLKTNVDPDFLETKLDNIAIPFGEDPPTVKQFVDVLIAKKNDFQDYIWANLAIIAP